MYRKKAVAEFLKKMLSYTRTKHKVKSERVMSDLTTEILFSSIKSYYNWVQWTQKVAT
jgi:hypothetical protein